MKFCECGCGQEIKSRANFVPGHDAKLKGRLTRQWREEGQEQALNELRRRNWIYNADKDERTFGIEIECLVTSKQALLSALHGRGLQAEIEGYNHQTRPHWKIVNDGSVNSRRLASQGYTGCELVSPILKGADGRRQLELACKALSDVNAKVNITCGLHVHHGTDDLKLKNFKQLALLYSNFEDQIDQMFAKSRRASRNTYCQTSKIPSHRVDSLKRCSTVAGIARKINSGCRYTKLNFNSYVQHSTIEFRQHQGTIEFSKIMNWIEFGQAAIRTAKRGNVESVTFNSHLVMDVIELDSGRREFWQNRIASLAMAA